jgi:RecJ-like exonuclease
MGPSGMPTVVCPLCGGLGVLTVRTPLRSCDACHGTGWVLTEPQTEGQLYPSRSEQQIPSRLITCPFCEGTGQILTTDYEPCVMCQRTGRIRA